MKAFSILLAFAAIARALDQLSEDPILEIQELEEIIESLTTENQVEFMIEHIENEKEAEARAEIFESITPEVPVGVPPFQNREQEIVVAS